MVEATGVPGASPLPLRDRRLSHVLPCPPPHVSRCQSGSQSWLCREPLPTGRSLPQLSPTQWEHASSHWLRAKHPKVGPVDVNRLHWGP